MEIAAAVVHPMMEKSIEAFGREVCYALEFRGHFDQTKGILEVAKKFLGNKEIINHKLKEGHVKPALIQLRKLIYEADDVVTDCLIRDEYKRDGFFGFLHQCNPFFLHQAGKKLENINSQMKEELVKLGAYKIPNNPQSQAHGGDDDRSQNEERKMSSQDYNPDERIVGISDDIEKIKKWIHEGGRGLQCIAIVGMGGLGKTTIAQEIYNDTEVHKEFQTIWVPVSKNFNEDQISKHVLKKLGGQISDSSQLMRALVDARKIKKDVLVVMDDVWSIDNMDWWGKFCKALTIADRSTCIIVTTRIEDVAHQVAKECRIHKPRPLGADDSWLLFSMFTDGICNEQEFEEIGRKILEKCSGLPLSIKTIGSLLASKGNKLSTWTEILESFHTSAVLELNDDPVMASLRLSYDELKAHLKQCLLCLSVYPEDHEIRAEQIIHWWVAEGLVPRKGSNEIELGYQCLSALISRCLVEVKHKRNYDGKVYTFKMHDMVRELIMKIAQSEEFCTFNEKGIQEWKEDSYWLGIIDEMIVEIESFGKNLKLRSLVLVRGCPVNFVTNLGFPLSLRMLNLSGCCSTNLDKKKVKNLFDWIASLKRLACLNLSDVTCLEELPSSVCKLQNLQILVLTGCTKLTRLHKSITKVKKLIVLHVGGCPLEYLPRGLERLTGLQELTGFRVISQQNSKACSLLELSKLINLRQLQMVISDDDFEILESELKEVLSNLANLKVLYIDANNCRKPKAMNMLNCLNPPKALKELYLRNYRGMVTLPKWVHPSFLPELRYLCVEDGDITNFIPRDKNDRASYVWKKLEGLSLKDLKKLVADWDELNKVMPLPRKYIEIDPAYGEWTNLPSNVQQSGLWRGN